MLEFPKPHYVHDITKQLITWCTLTLAGRRSCVLAQRRAPDSGALRIFPLYDHRPIALRVCIHVVPSCVLAQRRASDHSLAHGIRATVITRPGYHDLVITSQAVNPANS